MTDCPNAGMREMLPLLAAGRLDDEERRTIEAHLRTCADCRAELALVERVRATTARMPAVEVARVAAAVRGASRATRQLPSRATTWRRWRVSAAAAAAVVLALLAYDGRTAGDPVTPGTTAAAPAGAASGGVGAGVSTEEGLSFGGGLADLSTDELEQLVASLDDIDLLPSADPRPVAPEIPLELEGTL
ncbi:MAG TPA: zf-HC2 domain-containing protein [Gemmatimonadaceae bacterium]